MAIEPTIEDAEGDAPALSHKQQRKLKRKRERAEEVSDAEDQAPKAKAPKKPKTTDKDKPDANAPPKRENSVWVGNLSYKTTPDDLRLFFEGTGEITRINMPKGPIKGTAIRRENSGYAYVDFATKDAKTVAISLSERNLHGRRLLIKDGSNFEGSKSATALLVTDGKPISLTKTSKRILANQKEPPCPVLFMGNLGFEATKEQIRDHLLRHAVRKSRKDQKQDEEQTAGDDEDEGPDDASEAGGSSRPKPRGKPGHAPVLSFEPTSEPSSEPKKSREKKDPDTKSPAQVLGLRKIRLFTFEDTGKCKGFCFLDFESTAHATAALIHPANHHWNGRDLSVQYASIDAVRRGGYAEADGKRVFVKGARHGASEEKAFGLNTEPKISEAEDVSERSHATAKRSTEQAEAGEGEAVGSVKPFKSRGPTGGRVKQDRSRPKPGAALAAAQRATSGIVPGQGKKIKF